MMAGMRTTGTAGTTTIVATTVSAVAKTGVVLNK
jgi:hypothetical protein